MNSTPKLGDHARIKSRLGQARLLPALNLPASGRGSRHPAIIIDVSRTGTGCTLAPLGDQFWKSLHGRLPRSFVYRLARKTPQVPGGQRHIAVHAFLLGDVNSLHLDELLQEDDRVKRRDYIVVAIGGGFTKSILEGAECVKIIVWSYE